MFANRGGSGTRILCKILAQAFAQQPQNYVPRRSFRTTQSRNAIPPGFLTVLNKGAQACAVLIGRKLKNLSPEAKAVYLAKAKKHRSYLLGLTAAGVVGSFAFYRAHIEEAPVTKRKRFLAVSEDQMNLMAEMEFKSLLERNNFWLLPSTDEKHQRVFKVAQRLIDANRDLFEEHCKNFKQKKWTLSVIDDKDNENAFVLSCGNIFVFTGLINLCNDEMDGMGHPVSDPDSALAVILGHELAHVLLSHSREQLSVLHLYETLLLIPLLLLWCFVQSDATAALFHWISGHVTELLLHLPYSRALEMEADDVGLLLAARACFDVRECFIWKKFEVKRRLQEGDDNGTDADFDLLSTHPSSESRYENLIQKLPEVMATRDSCACPKLEPFIDTAKRIQAYEQKLKESTDNSVRLVAKPLEL